MGGLFLGVNVAVLMLLLIFSFISIVLLVMRIHKLESEFKRVTAEKLLEDLQLYENRNLLHSLISDLPCFVSIIRPDFTSVTINNALARVMNLPPEECVGKKCYNIFGKDGKKCSNCPVEQAIVTGKVSQNLKRKMTVKDRAVYIEQTAIPIFRKAGALKYIFEIVVDATEKIQLQLEMNKIYLQVVKTLVNLIESRDEYTGTHSLQVHDLAIAIGEQLDLSDEILDDKISGAAILHDIGKIGIPEKILNKPDKLLDREFEIMKQHCQIGYNSVKDIHNLHDVAEFILHHHENFDGSGYPDGLKGTDIPLVSRIIRVADVYSALTAERVYRPAMAKEQALKIIVDGKGKEFDPAIVDAFLHIIN